MRAHQISSDKGLGKMIKKDGSGVDEKGEGGWGQANVEEDEAEDEG